MNAFVGFMILVFGVALIYNSPFANSESCCQTTHRVIPDSQDVIDVAWTIYNEAKGETYHGKCAVATVIYNRAMTKRKTYQAIVKEPNQFAYFEPSDDIDNTYYDQCLFLSRKMHNGKFEPLDNWNCFFNPDKCTPYWYKTMTNKSIIDHHLFGVIRL